MATGDKPGLKFYSRNHFTIIHLRDDLLFTASIGVLLYAVWQGFGTEIRGLFDPREAFSILVSDLAVALGLWWILGERSRDRMSNAKDLKELWETYKHLRIHYWYGLNGILGRIGLGGFGPLYYIVENTNTNLAYDSPGFLAELVRKNLVRRVKHKNEPEVRDYLEREHIHLEERMASFPELMA